MDIKKLKELLYKKIKESIEEKKIEEKLPGFVIKKSTHFIEIPEIKDITKVSIVYPLAEPLVYANIKWDEKEKAVIYNVIEPQLEKNEKELFKKFSEALIDLMEVGPPNMKDTSKAIKYLEEQIRKIADEFGIKLTPLQHIKIMYYIYRDFLGYNEIDPLLKDPNIEDISCDGFTTPVYVVHRKFGSLKTNVKFENMENLKDFVVKLAQRCGRYVTYAEPILDGTLPDGSRVSATLAGDVATHGPTFTIRKFGERPFSPIDQIELNTASAEMLAYYWYMIENGASMLIAGGTSTGKTSFLNSICMFIPSEAKIVSIEDTREIRIPHEHWIPSLSRTGFGIPTPTGEKYGEVTLFDLLKESFRQNPNYIIVGEVRGKETYVLFQGMAAGHPCLSTFHAGSLDMILKRLITPPIELPPSLIESLHVVTLMIHAKEKGKSARRVKEVIEIEGVDPKTNEIKSRVIFRWNPVTDTFEKVNESIKIEEIAVSKGGKLADALLEIERRKRILEWMAKKKIKDYVEFTKIVNQYYKEPSKILDIIEKEEGKIIPKPIQKKKFRYPILELIGKIKK